MNRKQLLLVCIMALACNTYSSAQEEGMDYGSIEVSSYSQPQGTQFYQQQYLIHPQINILVGAAEGKLGIGMHAIVNQQFTYAGPILWVNLKRFFIGVGSGIMINRKILDQDNQETSPMLPLVICFRKNEDYINLIYTEYIHQLNYDAKIKLLSIKPRKLTLGLRADSFRTSGLTLDYKFIKILTSSVTYGWNVQNETQGITIALKISIPE